RSVRGRSRIPPNRRIPRQECWVARELFGSLYCRKAKSLRAPLLPRRSTEKFRAYRGSIELFSNSTRMASMRRDKKLLLRIFSGFFFRTCRNFTDAGEPHV